MNFSLKPPDTAAHGQFPSQLLTLIIIQLNAVWDVNIAFILSTAKAILMRVNVLKWRSEERSHKTVDCSMCSYKTAINNIQGETRH